jgi:hypothetical protein
MSKITKKLKVVESFLKGLDDEDTKYVRYMTRDQFSKYLTNKGYVYPTHDKPGSRYINVFGLAAQVNTKKPFGLIVYEPKEKRGEQYFSDPDEALTKAPDEALWQVINLWTGKIIYDPFNTKKEKPTLQEREWDTETDRPESYNMDIYRNMLGKLTGFPALRDIKHSHQASLYSVYVKNSLGDYMGRPNSMNSKGVRHIGVDEFKKDMENIIKKAKYATKLKSKQNSDFIANPETTPDSP